MKAFSTVCASNKGCICVQPQNVYWATALRPNYRTREDGRPLAADIIVGKLGFGCLCCDRNAVLRTFGLASSGVREQDTFVLCSNPGIEHLGLRALSVEKTTE